MTAPAPVGDSIRKLRDMRSRVAELLDQIDHSILVMSAICPHQWEHDQRMDISVCHYCGTVDAQPGWRA